MADFLIWLLAAFGCSSLLVMLLERVTDRMSSSAESPDENYRLLIRDSEQVLEGVIRSLLFRSYWSGKSIRITLQDEGSTDDSLKMAALYERYPYCWSVDRHQGIVPSNTIIIDLRSKQVEA
ncbi:glycosyltransferase family 2 protein [Brevibacillus invocatus]|uniref:glycosyltransferase family 2 protein n=1 Tax=Brevibacillus invocatus TaxID=173959 RepID=UPI00203F9477|nr:glycosyltransferase family 2 protein [Brevibacillus invocatus]MCM3079644.1 glycosyltransferase family 2 protein [Brevibacillus invocatus]MCM3431146.1 glycosyltransferase family 2 protein [Brevibacillus invocatus]